jgi:hypothetical protein
VSRLCVPFVPELREKACLRRLSGKAFRQALACKCVAGHFWNIGRIRRPSAWGETPVHAPSEAPAKIGSVNVEEFSRNLARAVEEGGRALASYLKPRDEGRGDQALADEITDAVKTFGQVAQ